MCAIDVKSRREGSGWDVYLNGGRVNTGRDALEWAAEAERRGAGEILLTSMDADGTKDGYDLAVTKAVADIVRIPVIASGGAGKMEHFKDVIQKAGADAVLVASLFHYGEMTVREVQGILCARKHTGKNVTEGNMNIDQVKFDDKGLVPVVAQDIRTHAVLMVAYMDREALEKTLETGDMTYYSRSRRQLWRKGETSGHVQKLHELKLDCDGDTLLALVSQTGPSVPYGALFLLR